MDDNVEQNEEIYYIIRDTFIDLGLVFFGGYASTLYSKKHAENHAKRFIQKIPDFDVLSEDPQRSATIVKERLEDAGLKKISITHHKCFWRKSFPKHYENQIRLGHFGVYIQTNGLP